MGGCFEVGWTVAFEHDWLRRAVVAASAGALLALGCGGGHDLPGFADAGGDSADAAPPRPPPPGYSNPDEPVPCGDGAPAGAFCDATGPSGIARVTPVEFEEITGGVALFDADGDRDLDLFAAGGKSPAALYRNDGTGRFTDVTAQSGLQGVTGASGVAAGDLDRDGDQDLVIAGHNVRYRIFRNDGGTFTALGADAGLGSARHEGMSVVLHDVDRDGWLDIYVTNWISLDQSPLVEGLFGYDGEQNYLFRNLGGLQFEDVSAAAGVAGDNATSLAAAFFDADGDGIDDLYVANDFGMGDGMQANLDLRGNGDGTFAPATPASGGEVAIFAMGVAPGDFDNDGDIDVYTTNIGRNVLLANDGAGGFADIAVTAAVEAYGFYDPSQDLFPYPAYDPASPDATLGGLATWAGTYLHVADPVHTTTSWAANWLDYDQDGDLDLHVCNGFLAVRHIAPEARRQPNVLYRNDGDGTFADVTSAAGVGDRGDGRSCVTGDIDGDGDLDLVIGNTGFNQDAVGGRLVVLRNDAATGNWIQVELRGTASNPDGIGAVVRARKGTRVQTRVISGGDGFLGTSMRRAHFGLGSIDLLDELTVEWPSGATTRLTGVPANQLLTLVE